VSGGHGWQGHLSGLVCPKVMLVQASAIATLRALRPRLARARPMRAARVAPLLARSHAAWRTGLTRPAPAATVSLLFTTKARPPSQTADGARVESFSEGFDRGNAAYLGRTSDRDDDGKIVIPWVTVATTAAVLGAYVAYFYLVEQPSLPPDPEPSLASEVVRLLPDGRMLMKDGSIQAPQSSEGFVAAPAFQGARPGMCFKKGPAGIGYYVDGPLHYKRSPQSAPPA